MLFMSSMKNIWFMINLLWSKIKKTFKILFECWKRERNYLKLFLISNIWITSWYKRSLHLNNKKLFFRIIINIILKLKSWQIMLSWFNVDHFIVHKRIELTFLLQEEFKIIFNKWIFHGWKSENIFILIQNYKIKISLFLNKTI
jgi:hypothetical protein